MNYQGLSHYLLRYFLGISRGENVGPSATARAADRRAHYVDPRRACPPRGQSAESRTFGGYLHEIRLPQFINEGEF